MCVGVTAQISCTEQHGFDVYYCGLCNLIAVWNACTQEGPSICTDPPIIAPLVTLLPFQDLIGIAMESHGREDISLYIMGTAQNSAAFCTLRKGGTTGLSRPDGPPRRMACIICCTSIASKLSCSFPTASATGSVSPLEEGLTAPSDYSHSNVSSHVDALSLE